MPELVTSSGEVAFRTALWFWMTPQAPKPSCHDVMTGGFVPDSTDVAEGRLPGFGMTVLIINGGLECNRPTPPAVSDRLGFYDRFTTALGVSPGSNLDCATMQAF
jgi:chitinase